MQVKTKTKAMINFQKSYIYKLVNSADDQIFISGGTAPTKIRIFQHKQKAKNIKYATSNPYKHLNTIGWNNVTIIVIEKFPCNSKMELLDRIQYWVLKLHPKLNIK